jgi:hypothetical protein
MRYIKLLPVIVLLNLSYKLAAQEISAGIRYSYGEGTYKQINDSKEIAFSTMNQFGLALAFSPYYSRLSLESGILFERYKFANYISIPLGFRVTLGKRVKPYFEGGTYYSFLLNNKSDIYKMKNDYGARFGGGLQFAFGRQWRLEIGTFKKYGFAGTLVKQTPIPGNNFQEVKSRISPWVFDITFKYRY